MSSFIQQQYQYLVEKFGVSESHFLFYATSNDEQQKGLDVTDETIALLQNLLSGVAHEKLNFRASGEYPLADAVKIATIDGKIAAYRELLDAVTLRRQELLRSR